MSGTHFSSVCTSVSVRPHLQMRRFLRDTEWYTVIGCRVCHVAYQEFLSRSSYISPTAIVKNEGQPSESEVQQDRNFMSPGRWIVSLVGEWTRSWLFYYQLSERNKSSYVWLLKCSADLIQTRYEGHGPRGRNCNRSSMLVDCNKYPRPASDSGGPVLFSTSYPNWTDSWLHSGPQDVSKYLIAVHVCFLSDLWAGIA
jgi:hypothetical protein